MKIQAFIYEQSYLAMVYKILQYSNKVQVSVHLYDIGVKVQGQIQGQINIKTEYGI